MSTILPSPAGCIEVTLREEHISGMGSCRFAEQDLIWSAWISPSPSAAVTAVLRGGNPHLVHAVNLIRFAEAQAQRRLDRGGPFASFAILLDGGLLRQPWLRSGRIEVGDWWRSGVRDEATGIIVGRRCWLDAAAFPDRLMARLSDLAGEMEDRGENTFFDLHGVDLETVEAEVRVESDRQAGRHHPQLPPAKVNTPQQEMAPHLVEFRKLRLEGIGKDQAADLVNKKYGLDIQGRSYQSMFTKKSKEIENAS